MTAVPIMVTCLQLVQLISVQPTGPEISNKAALLLDARRFVGVCIYITRKRKESVDQCWDDRDQACLSRPTECVHKRHLIERLAVVIFSAMLCTEHRLIQPSVFDKVYN